MKKIPTLLVLILGSGLSMTGATAAEPGPAQTSPPKKALGVLAAGEPEAHRIRERGKPVEMETVTFLGVEVAPAGATLASHLNLPRGAGLVVHAVNSGSPAEGVFERHDILLKLDDQLLIEQRQLAVLIRQRAAGDEVAVTFLRGGKQQVAKVKLGARERPKTSGGFEFAFPPFKAGSFAWGGTGGPFGGEPAGPRDEEEVDHLLRLIQRGPGAPDAGPGAVPPATRIFIDRGEGPGFRAMTVNPGNSNLVYSDDEGSLELTIKRGARSLVAKDAAGEIIFSGPVNTPEERTALPESLRRRLEQLEDMRDVSFETDEAFEGSEVKIIQPPARGVFFRRAAPPREAGNERATL